MNMREDLGLKVFIANLDVFYRCKFNELMFYKLGYNKRHSETPSTTLYEVLNRFYNEIKGFLGFRNFAKFREAFAKFTPTQISYHQVLSSPALVCLPQ